MAMSASVISLFCGLQLNGHRCGRPSASASGSPNTATDPRAAVAIGSRLEAVVVRRFFEASAFFSEALAFRFAVFSLCFFTRNSVAAVSSAATAGPTCCRIFSLVSISGFADSRRRPASAIRWRHSFSSLLQSKPHVWSVHSLQNHTHWMTPATRGLERQLHFPCRARAIRSPRGLIVENCEHTLVDYRTMSSLDVASEYGATGGGKPSDFRSAAVSQHDLRPLLPRRSSDRINPFCTHNRLRFRV